MPFNVGPLELVIVLVIALVILGPKRLPGGRQVDRPRDARVQGRDQRQQQGRRRRRGHDAQGLGAQHVRPDRRRRRRGRGPLPDADRSLDARPDRRAGARRGAERVLRHRRQPRRPGRASCSRPATPGRARWPTTSTATDLRRIYDEIDERGLDVGIIYHSHTRSDPVPSQTDINLASPFFPDVVYLIVGVKDPGARRRAGLAHPRQAGLRGAARGRGGLTWPRRSCARRAEPAAR